MEQCPFEITPLDTVQTITNPNIFSLNYTNQDFWSMKNRLIGFIQQKFEKDFNDFVESSVAIMLIENWAFLADTLSFKMDQIANEIFIDTVTELENAVRITRLVGFKPQPPIAARTLWTASINTSLLADLKITTPFVIEIAIDGLPRAIELFQGDATNAPLFGQDIIIPTGSLVNSSIVGLEGRTTVQNFTGTGEIAQNIQLGFSPVISDSIQVAVDGVTWNEVEFFTDSQPRREFRVEFDSTYSAFVIFGNNRAGLIPSLGSAIQITYRVGGGTIGNIVSGFVQSQTVIPVAGFQFSVPVSFTNYTKGEFGYDGDTIEDIRRKLPAYARTQDRAVTGLDYKTLSDQFATPYFGQIGKSTAVLRNYGCAGNIIDIFVLAKLGTDGLTLASDDLKNALTDELDLKKMLTDFVCLRDGIIISTDVSIDLTLDKFFRKFEDEIKTRVLRRTNNFFSLINWDYGKTLLETDLIKNLSDVKEISHIDITFTTNDPDNSGQTVVAKYNEIIRPDDIQIIFLYQ